MAEVYPTVVFDIELGKHVECIDFDYKEFQDLASEADLSSEQVDTYTIHFSATDAVVGTGRYLHRKKTARVYIPTITGRAQADGHDPEELLNTTVIHETGHYVDHENYSGDKTTRNFQLRKYAVMSGFIACLGGAVAESNPLIAFGGVAFVIGSGYLDNQKYPMANMRPTERFAYSFEYANIDREFVSLVPKPR